MKHDIVFSQQVSRVHGAGVLRMHMLKVHYYFPLSCANTFWLNLKSETGEIHWKILQTEATKKCKHKPNIHTFNRISFGGVEGWVNVLKCVFFHSH